MVLRLINAHACNPGTTIMVEGQACTVRSNDISKTGKHGASKCRMEVIEVISGKKRIVAVPGDERFEVPMIEKRKAQVLSVAGSTASVMDLESYETLDLPFVEEIKSQLAQKFRLNTGILKARKS